MDATRYLAMELLDVIKTEPQPERRLMERSYVRGFSGWSSRGRGGGWMG